jgi:hypothetical protein
MRRFPNDLPDESDDDDLELSAPPSPMHKMSVSYGMEVCVACTWVVALCRVKPNQDSGAGQPMAHTLTAAPGTFSPVHCVCLFTKDLTAQLAEAERLVQEDRRKAIERQDDALQLKQNLATECDLMDLDRLQREMTSPSVSSAHHEAIGEGQPTRPPRGACRHMERTACC